MDVNDIINALNRVLDLGDQLDNVGGGVQGLTNGEHTTREACKIELSQFLLYIADGCSYVNDAQAAVLNLVLGDGYSNVPAYKVKELAKSVSTPDPSKNVTMAAFQQADIALSQQNGEDSSSLTNILVSLYEAFGQLMVAVNENPIAQSRYDRVISQFKTKASLSSHGASNFSSSSFGSSTSSDFDIDDDVLTQYTGDDAHVSVPDGITRIGDNAFSGKTSIQTIVLPDSVTVIGGSAFRHCDNLETINLPEGLTEIEFDAFTYCDSLTSLEIPSTVETVGGDAFLFCNHIKRIRIPSSLTDIGDDAFKYCSSLETVTVYGGRRSIAALNAMKEHFSDGVKVIWEGDEQATAKKEPASRKASNTNSRTTNTGTAKKTTSSSSKKTTTSTSSGRKASSTAKGSSKKGVQGSHKESYSDVITFDLPDGYQMIWEDKDDGTKECKIIYGEYTDDNGNTAYEFMATVSDTDIESTEEDTIPAGEKPFDTIHRRDPERRYISFSNDPEAELQVKETPINILGRQLKFYCLALLVQVSQNKLASVMRISSWDEEEPDKNVESYGHMLQVVNAVRYKGKALSALKLTAEELIEQLKPDFEGKSSMITGKIGLQIKNGDEVISDSVLSGDDEGNVHVEDDHHAPSAVDGKYAGYEIKDGGVKGTNKKLTRIEIPDGVTSIDDSAFEDYKSLTEVIVPASVRYIGNSAFSGCVKLAKINIPEGVNHISPFAFSGCKALTSIVLPESVTWIGMYAFNDCIKLATINIHEYITQIFSGAFQNCAALTRIDLPDGLDKINSNLFDGCKKLETVTIPETVTSIGSNAFNGCKKLKGIVIPTTVDEIGKFAFNECQSLTQIEIPEGVETLEDLTFSDCTGLTSVTLPSSLKTMEDYVFHGCKNLRKINIPSGIEKMGDGVFGDCEKLTDITLPANMAAISDALFKDCTGLKKVVIPSTVTAIGSCAFAGCANLTTISIPKEVTTIGDGAFMGCSSLTSITLPQGIEAIADSLFDGCSSLKKITIPESVESIGDQAFNACAALTEVTIPDGVKTIGSFAFDDCTALKSANLPGGVELGTWAFPDEVDVTYRLGNGRTTKRKPDSTPVSSSTPSQQTASSKKTVGRYTAVMPSDELYSHYGKLKREADKFKGMGVRFVQNNGEEFQALDLIEILENNGHKSTNVYRKLKAAMSADSYDLDDLALKMSQVFRVNESVFDSRHDDEGDIHERLMDKKWKLSALRSFAWTLADLADREGKSIDDYDYDDLVALCSFIEEREWLNYEEGSWFDGLCGHPDIHVFYMPGKMIENGEADEICNVLKFNPITSLDAFRSDLMQLRNAMIKLHNGLLKSRDRNEKLDTPASAVLQAWCVMAMSAKVAFFSEDGPMFFFHSYPSDSLNTKALSVGAKAAPMTKATPKQKKTEASTGMENAANYEIIRGADGRERIKLGEYPVGSPITWLVLEKKGQELLLLSEFALDAKPFCEASFSTKSTNEWHGCTLRTWLNGDFYTEAFSDSERGMILDDTHNTYKKSANAEEETPSATDKVFLLSAREVTQYFPQERDRICKASAYAKEHGAEIEAGPNQCSWWLRSPAVEMIGLSSWASSIRADGSGQGWGIYSGETCVRPVIRVKSSKFTAGSTASVPPASETNASSMTTGKKKTQAQELSELEETVNTAASELEQASDRPLTAEEQNAIQEAQGILANMQSQMSSTTSALEAHKENLRKQEEEKQRRIEEAKKKGKSSHDEVDMLAVLLIEEALGQLHRDDDRFAEIYAEDFGAYDAKQLIRLRKKVMPTIHDAGVIEAAKSDMLARTVEERFSISTGNYFNVSTAWDFDAKGIDAIEVTKQWYKPEELSELRKLMEEHKEKTRQSVSSQLTAFRSEWSDFRGIRGDLHISISTDSDPVPEAHNLFHVKTGRDLDVRISLTNPALGYISIPVMNVFASCWKVSPEDIWNAALQNSIEDSRGQSSSSRSDAMAAKAKALSQMKTRSSTTQSAATSTSMASKFTNTQSQPNASAQPNPNAKRIKELEESIAALQKEADSIGGLFGFIKRNKIRKEIEAQQRELESLKRQSN